MRSLVLIILMFLFLTMGFLLAQAQSATDIQTQIKVLLEKVAALQTQLKQTSKGLCEFNRNLFLGIKGDDVKCLQNYLGIIETGFFGSLTRSAVMRWQTENNISPASGYFGSISRKKYLELAPITAIIPLPEPTPSVPISALPTTTAPATTKPSPKALIKTGTGIIANNSLFNIGTSTFLYTGSTDTNRGYLFPGNLEIPIGIGNRTADQDISNCEDTKAYTYRGLSNICQFTDPKQFSFTTLTSDGIRFYDKIASKGGYFCNNAIMAFKQADLYGAIDFEKVDKENNLHYKYWLDESGGTNFGSLCSTQANIAKMASLLDNLKWVLQKLKAVIR